LKNKKFLEDLYYQEKPMFGIKAATELICTDFVSSTIFTQTSQ